jgi:hypothetical protein
MRKFWRNLPGALAAGLFLLAALSPGIVQAQAPTTTQFAPRQFGTQQTHYIRFGFQLTSCTIVSNTCVVKVGAVPYNSVIWRISVSTNTAFNSVTNDLISFGTNTTGTNIVAAGCVMHAQGLTACTVLATASSVTGNGATQTGLDGGFDIFMVYVSSGGAATTGNATILIEYSPANDGATCANVPFGSTAVGC